MNNNIPASRAFRSTRINNLKTDTPAPVEVNPHNPPQVVKSLNGTKPRRFQEDRVCQADGCNVKLSTYNRGPNCYTHTETKAPKLRGRPYERTLERTG